MIGILSSDAIQPKPEEMVCQVAAGVGEAAMATPHSLPACFAELRRLHCRPEATRWLRPDRAERRRPRFEEHRNVIVPFSQAASRMCRAAVAFGRRNARIRPNETENSRIFGRHAEGRDGPLVQRAEF